MKTLITKLVGKIGKIPRGLIIISLVYWIIFVLMHPIFDHAFQDDFAYAQTVKHLVGGGYLRVSEWTAVSFLAQAYWAALFSLLLGFSFKTLTISTIVIFYIGLVFFYFLLKELNLSDFISTSFTLLFLGYPWMLLLAYSFMTDVPYISVYIISFYFLMRGLKKDSAKDIFIGSSFSSISFLIRQTGILLPLSVFILLVLKFLSDKNIKKFTKLTFSTLLIPAVTFFLYMVWLNSGDNKTVGQILAFDKGIIYTFKNLIWPTTLLKIGIVSRFYAEIINRISVYLIQAVGLIWPLLFVFSWRKMIKQLKDKKFIKLFLATFAFMIFVLFLPPYSKIMLPKFENLYFVREIFFFNRYLGPFDIRWYQNFWDKSMLILVPIFAFLLSLSIHVVWNKFFYWKLRVRKKLFLRGIFSLAVIVFLAFYNQLKIVSRLYRTNVIISETWLFFLVIFILALSIFSLGFGFRFKRAYWSLDYYKLLIPIGFILVFAFVLISPFSFPEYAVSFIPFVIMTLAIISRSFGFNKVRVVAAIIFMLVISFINAKSLHTVMGSVWETSEKLVAKGVSPAIIETFEFAWYPWWFYEEKYAEKIKEFGGDKYKFERLRPWEEPKPQERIYTVQYIDTNKCDLSAVASERVKTLFIDGFVCATKQGE